MMMLIMMMTLMIMLIVRARNTLVDEFKLRI